MVVKQKRPPQQQKQRPGIEKNMHPRPETARDYHASEKLQAKVALITGGDSGIGRAVAILYAKEGADIAIAYLNEHEDARETERLIRQEGRKCMLISSDIGDEQSCQSIVKQVIAEYGKLDILVNNAAEQHPQTSIENISSEQLERTFRTNIFAMFYLVKAALPYLKHDAVIINTTSVTAYRGSANLLDYSATKGAIVAFTRSLAKNLIDKGIRVNAVAPGPVWTPLIPSTFPNDKVENFGTDTPMKRAGEPSEIAPSFVFLASADSSYITGQVLHPNGGEVING